MTFFDAVFDSELLLNEAEKLNRPHTREAMTTAATRGHTPERVKKIITLNRSSNKPPAVPTTK